MTIGDYLKTMTELAKKYRGQASDSIRRNQHMNDLGGECRLTQDEIDAILTDFINFVGVTNCCDYGLYTRDLAE